MVNTAMLKGKIVENELTQEILANKLGMALPTFSYKVNNKSEFKASEIASLYKLLHLTDKELQLIFFSIDVDF